MWGRMWDGGGVAGALIHATAAALLAVFCVEPNCAAATSQSASFRFAAVASSARAILAMPSPGAGPSSAGDDLAELNRVAFMHEAVLFVLRGASVRKFGADGRKAPRTVTLRMDGANNRVVWHGSEAQVESVSGDMFGDDFLGDAYFDKRLHEEALCLSLGLVGGKTLFLLAPNEFEKDRWVHGVGALLSGEAQENPDILHEMQKLSMDRSASSGGGGGVPPRLASSLSSLASSGRPRALTMGIASLSRMRSGSRASRSSDGGTPDARSQPSTSLSSSTSGSTPGRRGAARRAGSLPPKLPNGKGRAASVGDGPALGDGGLQRAAPIPGSRAASSGNVRRASAPEVRDDDQIRQSTYEMSAVL